MIRFLRIYLQEHMEYLLDYKSIFQWFGSGSNITYYPISYNNECFRGIVCRTGDAPGNVVSIYSVNLDHAEFRRINDQTSGSSVFILGY